MNEILVVSTIDIYNFNSCSLYSVNSIVDRSNVVFCNS